MDFSRAKKNKPQKRLLKSGSSNFGPRVNLMVFFVGGGRRCYSIFGKGSRDTRRRRRWTRLSSNENKSPCKLDKYTYFSYSWSKLFFNPPPGVGQKECAFAKLENEGKS